MFKSVVYETIHTRPRQCKRLTYHSVYYRQTQLPHKWKLMNVLNHHIFPMATSHRSIAFCHFGLSNWMTCACMISCTVYPNRNHASGTRALSPCVRFFCHSSSFPSTTAVFGMNVDILVGRSSKTHRDWSPRNSAIAVCVREPVYFMYLSLNISTTEGNPFISISVQKVPPTLLHSTSSITALLMSSAAWVEINRNDFAIFLQWLHHSCAIWRWCYFIVYQLGVGC